MYNFIVSLKNLEVKWTVSIFIAAETWPFFITMLIQCASLEISASKRRLPKLVFAKTLRIVVQRAEDDKFSGSKLSQKIKHSDEVIQRVKWFNILKFNIFCFGMEYIFSWILLLSFLGTTWFSWGAFLLCWNTKL